VWCGVVFSLQSILPRVAGIKQQQALKRRIDELQQPLLELEQALLRSNGTGSDVG
jgi:hypothetical protein